MVLRLPPFIRRQIIKTGLGLVRPLIRISAYLPTARRFAGTQVDVHLWSELSSARAGMNGGRVAPFRLLACDTGLYTGRIINVRGPVELAQIGLDCSEVKACEEKFRSWFEDEGHGLLERIAYVGEQGDLPAYMKPLAHEFVHWLCFKETAMATLVDMVSWRLRVDMMALSELVHIRTGLPRIYQNTMTSDLVRERLAAYDGPLDRLAGEATAVMIFDDIKAHNGFAIGFYPRIIAPIIEPATWVLVESDWTSTEDNRKRVLNAYFGDDGQTRQIASEILEESNAFLTRDAQSRKKLIEAVNEAMNMPLQKIRLYVRTGDLSGLQLELANRLRAILAGKDVERAVDADRRFTSVLQYMLTEKYESGGETTHVKVVDLISGLLSKEAEVAKYVTETLSDVFLSGQSHGAYTKPTVFLGSVVAGKYVRLRYDPLAGLTSGQSPAMDGVKVRSTGRSFGTLEDMVGDIPLSIRTALMMLMYFNASNCQELLEGLAYPLKLLENKAEAWALYESSTKELRAVAAEKDLHYPTDLDLRGFLDFWLYYVMRMGVYAECLHGLHGMWT